MLLLGSALVLAGVLGVAPDGATEPVLRWDAPPGCPSEAAMMARVERYVGRPLADEAVRARGRMEHTADGRYQLALELWGGPMFGPRSVRQIPSELPDERVLTTFMVGLGLAWNAWE
ncbi:MAG: hypothetical protein KDK70_37495 [Myxococcales bacterium]|nr:hypothetical protein [Myxococcales bacterium]